MAKCDSNCYWYSQCHSETRCEDYTPVSDDIVEESLIEEKRVKFYAEWVGYLQQD